MPVVALLGFAILLAGILNGCSDKRSDKTAAPTSPAGDSVLTPEPVPLSTPPQQSQIVESTSNEQVLTVAMLEERGATKLTTDDILALIVDHSIVFQHLGSGEYFEAIYLKNGHRLLTNIDSGTLEGEVLQDEYVVNNDKLRTEFKGTKVTTTIYRLEERYLAAVENDNGIVNFEIRDIVHAPLTVQVLKSQNAKVLSNDEIKQLFVGKNLLIKDLASGDEYSSYYGEDGMRTLRYNPPSVAAPESMEETTHDPFRIEDNKLHSIVDGNEIASTIFQLESHYYGAMSFDEGAVNYEFVPQ